MRLKTRTTVAAAIAGLALVGGTAAQASTAVPGHQGRDGTVTGKYTQDADGCTYQVQYRGDFGDDPGLDDGWIINNIQCDDGSAYNYLIVHESDPRYTGNDDLAVWGNWEYRVYTSSGSGNVANPMHPEYIG